MHYKNHDKKQNKTKKYSADKINMLGGYKVLPSSVLHGIGRGGDVKQVSAC